MKGIVVLVIVGVMLTLAAPVARAQAYCAGGGSKQGAMWLSIAHPGLGEYYLKGWGDFGNCPQRKFWLGLIPLYGWPGYLQVKSAIDSYHCRTNDELVFE